MMSTVRPFQRGVAGAGMLGLSVILAATLGCNAPASPESASSRPQQPTAAPSTNDEISLSADARRSSGMTVAEVIGESRADHFETPAVLDVNETRTSRLGSVVDGVVTEAGAQVGDRVRQGQQLARIHSHAVHDAWAGYRKAIADRQRATAELAYAVSAEARAERLLATKAVSVQEMERARTDRLSAEQTLAVAESEVRRSLDELEHLGINAENVESSERRDAVPVLAPSGGVVLERHITPGTAVTVGSPLYVVSDLSTLWAMAEVDEARLPVLSVGSTAHIMVATYATRNFPARVTAISDSVSPETRRVRVRIEVDNRDGLLKPQMFATVRLATGEASQVAMVPAAAVQQLGQQSVVFVEVSPGTFRRQPVTLGPQRDGRVEVSGVAPGTRIVVNNAFLLKSTLLASEQPE